jgi:hypothetical protein
VSFVLLLLSVITLLLLTAVLIRAWLDIRKRRGDEHGFIIAACLWIIGLGSVLARASSPSVELAPHRLLVSGGLLVAGVYLTFLRDRTAIRLPWDRDGGEE